MRAGDEFSTGGVVDVCGQVLAACTGMSFQARRVEVCVSPSLMRW